MKVILKEDVDNLGVIGDTVEVAAGYARNYLVPRQLAVEFTKQNAKQIEHERRAIAKKREKALFAAKSLADKIGSVVLETEVAVGEKGKLFGSVTILDIVDLAAKAGVELDRKQIRLERPIKTLGETEVPVRLGVGVMASLKVSVKPDRELTPAEEAPEKAAEEETEAAEKPEEAAE